MYRVLVLVARFLLGLPFVVFGLNTVLWSMFDAAFIQPPDEMPVDAQAFMEGLTSTGFANQLRGVVEVLAGLLILSGVYAPLGLVLLAPIVVHIVFYHHMLDPQLGGRVIADTLLGLGLFLAWVYRPAFAGLLRPTRLQLGGKSKGR